MEKSKRKNDNGAKPNKNFAKKLGKLLLYLVLIFVIFSFALYFFTKTDAFREWASEFISDQVNSALEADVYFSDFQLNGFLGLELNNVIMISAGDTLARIRKISVDFDPYKLLDNELDIHRVSLNNPRIRLLRSNDLSWNFEHIVPPSDDTTSSGKAQLKINLDMMEINNASIRLFDSTSDNSSIFSDSRITDLNLELIAEADIGINRYKLKLEDLNFKENNSGLILEEIDIEASIDTNSIALGNLSLKTGNSDLSIDASVVGVNLFGEKFSSELKNAGLDINIDIANINSKEFEPFSDQLPISGDISLLCKISGRVDSINMEKLLLTFYNSHISLNGKINGLLSESISPDIVVESSLINTIDISSLLTVIKTGDIPDLEGIKLNGTKIYGDSDSLSTYLNIKSEPVNIEGLAGISLKDSIPVYSALIDIRNLDLKPLLRDNSLASDIDLSIKANGRSFDINNLVAVLDMEIFDSRFKHIDIKNGKIHTSIDKSGILHLDTMSLAFKNPISELSYSPEEGHLFVNANINVRDLANSDYYAMIEFDGINPAHIVENPGIPNLVSGAVKVQGKYIDLDQLNADVQLEVSELMLGEMFIFPFNLQASLQDAADSTKHLVLKSDFADVDVRGEFIPTELIDLMANHGQQIGEDIVRKIDNIYGNTDTLQATEFEKYPALNFKLSANVNDLSVLNSVVDSLDITANTKIDLSFESDSNKCHTTINELQIENFGLDLPGFDLNISETSLSGDIELIHDENYPYIGKGKFKIFSASDIFINDLLISGSSVSVDISNKEISFNAGAGINNTHIFGADGKVVLSGSAANVRFSNIEYSFDTLFTWRNQKEVNLSYDNNHLKIYSFNISRDNFENISVQGSYDLDGNADIECDIRNFTPLSFISFVPENLIEYVNDFRGKFDSLHVHATRNIENPSIKVDLYGDSLAYNKNILGAVSLSLEYQNQNISGNANFTDKNITDSPYLDINIIKLPMNLLAKDGKIFVKNTESDISIIASQFPLQIVSPFIPGISDIRGPADLNLKIGGYLPEDPDINGQLSFDNAVLVLEATNMRYYARGVVDINEDKINIRRVNLYNQRRDLNNGAANVEGFVTLNEFMPDKIDIKIKTDRFMVLGPSSIKSMPGLYGDFVIQSGDNPIHFFGTLDEPNLEGDINVLRADLQMPQEIESTQEKSTFRYIIGDELLTFDDKYNPDSSNISTPDDKIIVPKPSSLNKQEVDFSELINYDLRIKILGPFDVTMELPVIFSSLTAEIGTRDRSVPIRYVKTRNKKQATLYGELLIKEGSKLKIYRTLEAQGNINFPSGSIEDPGLDITAEYPFRSTSGETTKEYVVKLRVSGTKSKLNLSFTYLENGEEATGDSTEIAQDAIFLLTFGKTKNELMESGFDGNLGQSIGTQVSSIGTSYLLSQLFSGIKEIQSADIDFGSDDLDFSQARLKLTGQLWGLRWEIGGSVVDLANNYEFTIDVPIAALFQTDLMNINLTITRSTSMNISPSLDQKEWEVKFKIGGSW